MAIYSHSISLDQGALRVSHLITGCSCSSRLASFKKTTYIIAPRSKPLGSDVEHVDLTAQGTPQRGTFLHPSSLVQGCIYVRGMHDKPSLTAIHRLIWSGHNFFPFSALSIRDDASQGIRAGAMRGCLPLAKRNIQWWVNALLVNFQSNKISNSGHNPDGPGGGNNCPICPLDFLWWLLSLPVGGIGLRRHSSLLSDFGEL